MRVVNTIDRTLTEFYNLCSVNYMDLIKKERFTSIQEAQAGLTNIIRDAAKEGTFYRVLRNNKPIGVLLPNEAWEDIIEDMEAASSPNFLESLDDAEKSDKYYSPEEIRKELNSR